jgi:hypothetical protein
LRIVCQRSGHGNPLHFTHAKLPWKMIHPFSKPTAFSSSYAFFFVDIEALLPTPSATQHFQLR